MLATQRVLPVAAMLAALLGAGCSDDTSAVADQGAGADLPSADLALADMEAHDAAMPAEMALDSNLPAPDAFGCFALSLDPNLPLALDGTFSAASTMWRRPHDEDPVCPATALTPADKADVPFVAYGFCNNDSVPHTVTVEMLAQNGPKGQPPLDDPYLFVYSGKGIPADPLQCLKVNDDIEGALNTKDAEITGLTVPAGGAITVVGTTFTFHPTDGTGTGYYILVITVTDI